MSKNLVNLNIDNAEYSLRPMMTATIENDIIAVNAAEDFEVVNNASIAIKPTNTATVNSPSLLINGILYPILKPSNIFNFNFVADNIYELIYDGDGKKWVYLNDNLTDLKYFKYFTPDNSGRATFTLIAKLDKWKSGTNSNYYLIGTMYGQRGGNMSRTGIYNIVAQAVSYSTIATQKLYVTDYPSQACIMPYIVAYTKGGVTENYLALKKIGSGDYIYFQGLMGDLLPQNEWIELNVPDDADLPTDMTIVASPGVNQAHITTEKYFDGSNARTLLHSGNYTNYTVKKDGAGATGTWNINISGSAVTAENATTATNLDTKPSIQAGTNNTITVTAGNQTSAEFTVPFATEAETATTATNLDAKPSIQAGTNNTITITAGNQTSAEFTVPFATEAETATNAVNAENATTATNAANANRLNDIQYFTYKFNDFDNKAIYPQVPDGASDGDDTYVLIADLSDWVNDGKKYCNHYLIGTIYGNRNDKQGTNGSNANTHGTEIYNIFGNSFNDLFLLLLAYFFYLPCRNAGVYVSAFHTHARCHKCICRHDGTALHYGVVEDRRSHSYQAVALYRSSMYGRVVSYGDIVAYYCL